MCSCGYHNFYMETKKKTCQSQGHCKRPLCTSAILTEPSSSPRRLRSPMATLCVRAAMPRRTRLSRRASSVLLRLQASVHDQGQDDHGRFAYRLGQMDDGILAAGECEERDELPRTRSLYRRYSDYSLVHASADSGSSQDQGVRPPASIPAATRNEVEETKPS